MHEHWINAILGEQDVNDNVGNEDEDWVVWFTQVVVRAGWPLG